MLTSVLHSTEILLLLKIIHNYENVLLLRYIYKLISYKYYEYNHN